VVYQHQRGVPADLKHGDRDAEVARQILSALKLSQTAFQLWTGKHPIRALMLPSAPICSARVRRAASLFGRR
jgi:hypothetical protein